MAIAGRLGGGGAADLLATLSWEERSGILDLTVGETSRKFVFRGGEIVYLISDERTEKLPIRLVAKGLVSKELMLEASKAGQDPRAALAERGLPEERYDAELRGLIADAAHAVFSADEGSFSFVEKPDLQLPGVLARNDMTALLWDCARSLPPKRIEALVGPTGNRLRRIGEDEDLALLPGLGPQEGYVLSRIDGYGSVEDLCGSSPLGREETLGLVAALTCAGFLEITGRPGLKLPRSPAARAGSTKRKPAAKPKAASTTAPVAPTPAVIAEPLTPLERAREMHEATKEADHYTVLSVGKKVEAAEVRKAYYALAKAFHPDRFAHDLEERERDIVEDLFARIGEAFRVLSDPEERKRHDEQLAAGTHLAAKQDEGPSDPREVAKQSFQKGIGLLQAGEKGRAVRFLEHAVDRDPDGWDYRIALAKLYMSDSRTRRKAEEHLKQAIRINQSRAEAYYQLALLYKAANLKSRALEQLRAGQAWDAEHAGIREELAALGGDEKTGSGGLLGGLFGKKD